MNDVKRYDCTSGGASYCQGCYTMTEAKYGDYVLADDFDKLEAEAQALREEVAALREAHDKEWRRAGMAEENLKAVLGARVVVPDGYALVPVVATDKMVEHVMSTGLYHDQNASAVLRDEYRHMVEAAPRLNGKAVRMADISACLDAELREWTGDHRKAVERALTDANGRIMVLLGEGKEHE